MALKELVDTFLKVADQKYIPIKSCFLLKNATVVSVVNGQEAPALKGRKQIGEVFAGFLSNFETVYHINGQQTVTVSGNNATGISFVW